MAEEKLSEELGYCLNSKTCEDCNYFECYSFMTCKGTCKGLLQNAYERIREIEEFEEIFHSKMTDTICNLLSDKEEFAKWLDRNKWIAKKCDKYARAEEQGKLLKLPCVVGADVWYISEKVEKQGRKKVENSFVDHGVVDNITLGDMMIPQITVCNDKNVWATFDGVEDFGKNVFLTKSAAEQALKELEEKWKKESL